MKIAIVSFTSSGNNISKKIKDGLNKSVESSKPIEITEIDKNTFDDKLSKYMEDIFKNNDAIIFISSTGIAVRLIAPYVKDKTKDPAVIVVDDMGKFTISLLSGHIGGANNLSTQISNMLKNQLVITTASDNRGIDAVDIFAMRNNLHIEDMKDAKTLTSLMVENEKINLISEVDVNLNYSNVENSLLLEEVYSDKNKSKGVILISSANISKIIREDINKPICVLRPKVLNIGIGCRRGKSRDEILKFISEIFDEYNLSTNSIKKIGTIDIKHDEAGILEVSKELKAELVLFSKTEIESVSNKFARSDFVKKNVGVTSVCEPAAYLLGRELIIPKQISNGITIAVSRS